MRFHTIFSFAVYAWLFGSSLLAVGGAIGSLLTHKTDPLHRLWVGTMNAAVICLIIGLILLVGFVR